MTDPFEEFHRARERQDGTPWDTQWRQADAALALQAVRGRSTASELAEANSLSAAYVRQLIHTAETFPRAMRDPTLTFTHHRYAAASDQPRYWLRQAAEHGWSCRAMDRAIRFGLVLAIAQDRGRGR